MRKNIFGTIIAGALLATGVLHSCTEKNSFFGNGFVPPDQLMGASIDSAMVVRTYIGTYDSVLTNIANYYTPFFGSFLDPLVGRTTIQMFVNYAPFGFVNDNTYFGVNPVVDSMNYNFQFSDIIGDTATAFTVDVYEVTGFNAQVDSSYYSNFDMTPYIGSAPLFSFTQKDVLNRAIGKLPMEFAQRLVDNTQNQTNVYYSDTLFHKKFNGFYLKLRDQQPAGEGVMFQLDLSQCVMNLFYHNENTPDKDTTYQRFLFYTDMTFYNTNFMMVQHDFTQADPSSGGVQLAQIGDTVTPSNYCYIQGLSGLMGRIEVDMPSIERVKAEARAKGYSHVALQKAELQVTFVDDGWEEYKLSFSGLGIYHNMQSYDFLSEYDPLSAAVSSSGYQAWLGGGLNRSLGRFSFNITSYMQRLFTGKETRLKTQLLPQYYDVNQFLRTRVYGSASPYPPKLILTYTMVK